MKLLVEAAVDSVGQALDAERLGADRIELCAHLDVGGTTPSAGATSLACELITVPVFVMIRPRGGDFTATALEYGIMQRDVTAAKSAGADGLVLGILTQDGCVDVKRTTELVELARPLPITFHMAFDRARDRLEALDDLLATGVARVLTSGGAGRAANAAPVLAELVQRSAGKLTVVAGGGVVGEDVEPLAREAGVREVHARLTSTARMRAVIAAARAVR